jgi:hypothetical protein
MLEVVGWWEKRKDSCLDEEFRIRILKLWITAMLEIPSGSLCLLGMASPRGGSTVYPPTRGGNPIENFL